MGVTRLLGRFFLVGACASACGRGAPPGDAPAETTVGIGPRGGTITASGVTLVIPPGALANDVSISVSDDGVAPAGYAVARKIYRFLPSGLRFAIPIAVTMPGKVPMPIRWTLEGTDDRFASLETTYTEDRATATVTHFSMGFVGEETRAPDPELARMRPALGEGGL
jgi:hypothetical protein